MLPEGGDAGGEECKLKQQLDLVAKLNFLVKERGKRQRQGEGDDAQQREAKGKGGFGQAKSGLCQIGKILALGCWHGFGCLLAAWLKD